MSVPTETKRSRDEYEEVEDGEIVEPDLKKQQIEFSADLSVEDQVKLVTGAMKVKFPSREFVSDELTRLRGVHLKRNPDELHPYVNDSYNAFAGADISVRCPLLGKGEARLRTDRSKVHIANHSSAVRYVMSALQNGYSLVYDPFISWNYCLRATPENFAAEFIRQAVADRALH